MITVGKARISSGLAMPVASFIALISLVFSAHTQYANDSLLFTIELTEDTGSLFTCSHEAQTGGSMLAGPVVGADGNFTFYSSKGYAIYGRDGRLKDSHSVGKRNKRLSKRGKPLIKCAFPIDDKTFLYYRKKETAGDSCILLSKKNGRGRLRKIRSDSPIYSLKDIDKAVLFNLTANALTNEMNRKAYLQPYLVGYTSMKDGIRWWSLDRFFSFTSPLIVENQGDFVSFFPGLTKNPAKDIKKNLVEPLGVCKLGNDYHYYGVYTPTGDKESVSYQRLFLCDQAGNLLYDQSILKREMTDAVLAKSEAEKMLYTVKRPRRFVFLPAVDECGNIYYGIADFNKKRIEVIRRNLFVYKSVETDTQFVQILSREQGYTYRWDPVDCIADESVKHIPLFRFTQAGEQKVLTEEELRIDGYIARILREENSALKATINRSRSDFPVGVRRIQDSLSGLFGAWCPYSVELLRGSEILTHFNYPPGSRVVAVRVVAVTEDEKVFVRVDLDSMAEMLVFSREGNFLNRFTFNTEPFDVRADVIAITPNSIIVEKDYEVKTGGYRFMQWKLSSGSG